MGCWCCGCSYSCYAGIVLNALNQSILPGKVWLQGGGAGVAVNCSNVHRDE